MHLMRESWTDARLDDFAAHTDQRFDAVDKRFDSLERRMQDGFNAMNSRFDALNRTLLQIGGGIIATLIAGFFGVIVT
jgi:hypothetical protein